VNSKDKIGIMGGVAIKQAINEEHRTIRGGSLRGYEQSEWGALSDKVVNMFPRTLPEKFWPNQLRSKKMVENRRKRILTLAPIIEENLEELDSIEQDKIEATNDEHISKAKWEKAL
jgi:hypothetical protein